MPSVSLYSSSGARLFSVPPGSAVFPTLSAVQIVALALAMLGLVLGFSAILTPSWQIVYAREIDQWVLSGLWLNCQTRPNGMHTCVYSISADSSTFGYASAGNAASSPSEAFNNLRSPPFHAWQRTLLFALLAAQLLALIGLFSLCLSFHPPTRRLSAIVFLCFTALAVLLHSGSAITFAVLSQMVEYRFFHVSVSGIYEKHRGYSFLLELGTIGVLFVSLIPAAIHLGQVLREQQQQQKDMFEGNNNNNNNNNTRKQKQQLQYVAAGGGTHSNQFGIIDAYYSTDAELSPTFPQQYRQKQQKQKFLAPEKRNEEYEEEKEEEEERFAMRQLPPLPDTTFGGGAGGTRSVAAGHFYN